MREPQSSCQEPWGFQESTHTCRGYGIEPTLLFAEKCIVEAHGKYSFPEFPDSLAWLTPGAPVKTGCSMVSAERDNRNVQVPDHMRNPPHASPASWQQGIMPQQASPPFWSLESPSASLAFYPPVAPYQLPPSQPSLTLVHRPSSHPPDTLGRQKRG